MVKKAAGPIYPLAALRAAVLHAQRLTAPLETATVPTPDAFVNTVEALSFVQVDTLYVVNRAHYLTFWARLGSNQRPKPLVGMEPIGSW